MALLIFYVSLALGISFLCSIMEAVLLSVSPSFVARTEREHARLGRRLRSLKENVDQPLAAILSLNTIAHTVGAAGAGAQAAFVFGDAYVGVISAVLTFLILVISEIIPKTLGAVYWRQLAPFVVKTLVFTGWIMWPLVKLSDLLTKLIARGRKKGMVHREEFIALAELGAKEGVFYKNESRILANMFRFRDVRARDIMTPRTVVVAFSESSTVAEALSVHPELQFSRIPVYGKNRDEVTGFVLKSDLLYNFAMKKENAPLSELKRPIYVVSGDLPLHDLFDQLMNERAHIALVIDDFGGMEGIVTMEDLIETLLGMEIVDEVDAVEDMQELARRQWYKRARKLGLATEGGAPPAEAPSPFDPASPEDVHEDE